MTDQASAELRVIEAALRRHPAVGEALAVAAGTPAALPKVYVVPRLDSDHPEVATLAMETAAGEQVEHWRRFHDQRFADNGAPAGTPAGPWLSSYSRRPMPVAEVGAWADSLVELVLRSRPRRLLQVGCGTGTLLARLAPHCASYQATDISAAALRQARALQAGQPQLAHVTLSQRPADDWQNIPQRSLDAVVISAACAYFPTVDYLLRVLDAAVRAVAAGGVVVISDVRNLTLLPAFHVSVELYRAADRLQRAELGQRVEQRLAREQELAVDPKLFRLLPHLLPRIERVEIRVKRGFQRNELSLFRYDVLLHVGQREVPVAQRAPITEPLSDAGKSSVQSASDLSLCVIDWARDAMLPPELRRFLDRQQPGLALLLQVPDLRLRTEMQALTWLGLAPPAGGVWHLPALEPIPETVGDLRRQLGDEAAVTEPETFWRLGQELGYATEVEASETPGCFDVVLQRPARGSSRTASAGELLGTSLRAQPAGSAIHWQDYANQPLHGSLTRRLVPRLAQHLAAELPQLPAVQVVLCSQLPGSTARA